MTLKMSIRKEYRKTFYYKKRQLNKKFIAFRNSIFKALYIETFYNKFLKRFENDPTKT